MKIKSWAKDLFQKTEKLLNEHPYLTAFSTILLCSLLIISRRPEAITNAQFWAEDGKYWFADAYTQGPITSLFVTYGGYFVVAYRLIGSVSLILPFKYTPLFFNLVALVVQLLPLALILSSRLKKIIPYRTLAVVLCLLYVSVPNSSEVFLNLTNIQWHLGISAFLVLIASKSNKLVWKIFDLSILIAAGLAGPLVIILLPIIGYLYFKDRSSQNKRNLIAVAILSEIQFLAIFFVSGFQRVGGQPDASIVKFMKMIVGQVFTGSSFGEKSVGALNNGGFFVLLVIFSLIVAIFIYVLRRGPLWLKLMNIYGVLVVLSMLASLRSTKDFDTWKALGNPGGGQRYWYIPMIIWLTTLVWLLFRAKFKPLKYLAGFLLASLILVGITKDWSLKKYSDEHFYQYAEVLEQAPQGELVTIPTNPGWHIYLTKK